ncbi:hypothetical protein V1639_07445 [Pseudarthrobacter sp. J75]|uniref:hypothetical protein n=1 Tax=unclassified Pseudarthrobacter TaxID=2647000 RepID=UPI002E81328C|nr:MULTISPECIES: hypothetical protein [unclassified Pseudarthrobacter]MEE2521936.1 hypothetical protein [Pseudarthrobacter sp. J47]MEE2528861.1 hypothetical protein [Pseudarthrobacter sp. J75]
MGFKPGEENQSINIRQAMEEAGLDMGTVWIAYFTMGGNAGTWEVEAYIGGALSLPALERDILAQAINELIDELPPRRKATFSDDESGLRPGTSEGRARELMPPSSNPEESGSLEDAGGSGYGGRSDDEGDGDTRQRQDGHGGDQ